MNVAGMQGTALKVAELVEQEQGMVARAAEVSVVGRPLLFTMGWAGAGIHVENDLHRRVPVMNLVDPHPVHVGQGFNVPVGGQKLRLEAPHLAGRGCLFRDSLADDDPSHDRVEAEPVSIVHVAVPAKASENGLTKLPDKTVTAVLPTTGVREWVPAISVSPTASSSSRYGNNPASEETLEPWNSSFNRRSKWGLRTPSFDSPIG